MTTSGRSIRGRRLRPVLMALEQRALLSTATPEISHHVQVSKLVHIETNSRVSADHAKKITPVTYKFTTLNGPVPQAGVATPPFTNIQGISNSGTAVGFTEDADGNFVNFTATATKSVKYTVLNIGGATSASANAVNKQGMVVGTTDAKANGQAFILQGKKLTTFVPFGGSTAVAFGINDQGTVVGQYTLGGSSPGFIRTKGGSLISLNAPAGSMNDVVNAQGINNNGLIVGFYVGNDGQDHGFVANEKQAVDGTLKVTPVADPIIPPNAREPGATFQFSQILGVNDKGIAVGYYGDMPNLSQHGFIYNTTTGQYTFMDDPSEAFAASANGPVVVTQITGIANSGEISGFYTDAVTANHGFVASI